MNITRVEAPEFNAGSATALKNNFSESIAELELSIGKNYKFKFCFIQRRSKSQHTRLPSVTRLK